MKTAVDFSSPPGLRAGRTSVAQHPGCTELIVAETILFPPAPGAAARSLDDEIEPTESALVDVAEPHEQSCVKQAVASIPRLIREIQLGRQHRPTGPSNLDVNMSRAPGIETGHDGGKPPEAHVVRELMAPQFETLIVVCARLVGLPELHKRPRHWSASDVQDDPPDQDRFPGGYVGGEVALQGRVWCEVRPFGLRDRRLIAISTFRRQG